MREICLNIFLNSTLSPLNLIKYKIIGGISYQTNIRKIYNQNENNLS